MQSIRKLLVLLAAAMCMGFSGCGKSVPGAAADPEHLLPVKSPLPSYDAEHGVYPASTQCSWSVLNLQDGSLRDWALRKAEQMPIERQGETQDGRIWCWQRKLLKRNRLPMAAMDRIICSGMLSFPNRTTGLGFPAMSILKKCPKHLFGQQKNEVRRKTQRLTSFLIV